MNKTRNLVFGAVIGVIVGCLLGLLVADRVVVWIEGWWSIKSKPANGW